MLKTAILSRWHVHADDYAKQFQERHDAKLTAMWDEEPEKGIAFAKRYGLEFEADLDKLLQRSDVDAVCVTAPTSMHRELIVKAAQAGKHIFTEKVLALTTAECADIRAAVEGNPVKFCISFPHRTHPHCLLAKHVLEEKLLGDVTYLRVRNAHDGASGGWLPPHFYDGPTCGGGAMMDLGAHPMYLIAWLLGKPTEISSTFTSVTGRAVEDNAVSVMKYPSGAIAVSETGFVSSNSPFVLELYGTAGSLIITDNNIRLISSKSKEDGSTFDGWVIPSRLPDALPSPIAQFVEGVLYGKEILFSLDDAIMLTEIMEAAYKSHAASLQTKLQSPT